MITNEVIPENMVVVRYFEKFTSINLPLSSAQRFSMVGSLVGF